MKGINDALPSGTGVLRPVAPQHIEGQDACTHATHIRREQYLTLDNEIAGLIVMMITPDPKSGDEKPSFYSRCADVLKSECDDGGKSFRIMSIMATAQPTAHSVLVRKHANHWEDCKYQHGYALLAHTSSDLIIKSLPENSTNAVQFSTRGPCSGTESIRFVIRSLVHEIEGLPSRMRNLILIEEFVKVCINWRWLHRCRISIKVPQIREVRRPLDRQHAVHAIHKFQQSSDLFKD